MIHTEGKWYCLSADGIPMLCADEDDAKQSAKLADEDWPNLAPHKAAQLVDAEALTNANRRIEALERENAELKTLLKTSIEQHEIVGKLHQLTVEAALKECRNAALEEAALKCKAYGELPKVDSGVPSALAYQIRELKS